MGQSVDWGGVVVSAVISVVLYFVLRKTDTDDSKDKTGTTNSTPTPTTTGFTTTSKPTVGSRVTNGVWISTDSQLVIEIFGGSGYLEGVEYKSPFTFISSPWWNEDDKSFVDNVQFPNSPYPREFRFYPRQDQLLENVRGSEERLTRLQGNSPIPTPYIGARPRQEIVAETPTPTKPWVGVWRTVILGSMFSDIFLNQNSTGGLQNREGTVTSFTYTVESETNAEALLKATDASIRFPLFITYNKSLDSIALKQKSYTGDEHESGPFFRPRLIPSVGYYGKWISASLGDSGEWAKTPPPIELRANQFGSIGDTQFSFVPVSDVDNIVTIEATKLSDSSKFQMIYKKALDLLEVVGSDRNTPYVYTK